MSDDKEATKQAAKRKREEQKAEEAAYNALDEEGKAAADAEKAQKKSQRLLQKCWSAYRTIDIPRRTEDGRQGRRAKSRSRRKA